MATTDLRTFLEDRLQTLDPSLDLTAPAQTQFIDSIIDKLGTDPFETNIDSFITDRYAQEFPDQYAQDPSVIRDTLVKPLIVFLEPFKREIQLLKTNQSLKDPNLLSDEDADALAANFFEERDSGGYAVGTGRIFFSQPTNQQVGITTRIFTADGLNYFPTTPIGITAEQMVFQRSGALFYMDVPLKAEQQGTEYNIEPGTLAGVEGIFSAVKVTNLAKFDNGASKLDTPTFVATTEQALTERSLVNRRGATARILSVFQTDIRAVQVIGAGDEEMQRDVLVADFRGHAWLTGQVNLQDKIAYVQCRTVDGSEDDSPVPGDELYIYLDRYSYTATWAGLTEASRFVRFTVEEVLTSKMEEANPFRLSYLVRVSGSPPVGISIPNPAVLQGGFLRKGTVQVTSLPSVGTVNLTAQNGEVHVYGHSDIYVRPILQTVSKALLASLTDDGSYVERTTLRTVSGSNVVTDQTFDFSASGVIPGDVLVVETGNDAGTYPIRKVTAGTPGTLTIGINLTTTDATDTLRYRVLKRIGINPFEPRIPKFPFGNLTANDLSTAIGSKLFTLTTDILNFGAKVGDVFRVLEGTDEGDFTITGFDAALGGRGVLVDRAASGSNSSIRYEVFTAQEKVELPLVRIKQLLLLDSAKQSTGITVPPAEPVAVVPTSDFSSARVRAHSEQKSGYVLPDFTGYVSGGNVASPSGDRRYSLGFDPFTGVYRSMQFPDTSYAEFDFRADANGACSYFLAIAESTDDAANFPPIDPSPGECLTIKNGPNKGSYLIKQVFKFKHKLSGPKDVWSYFIQIYGTFPVDVFRQIITFLDAAQTAGAAGAGVTKITGGGDVQYPTFFQSTVNGLGAKLNTALTFYGAASPGSTFLQNVVNALTQVEYEWGDPARGVLRTFFTEPTLFEQHTANHATPTLYKFETDGGDFLHFRPEPERYDRNDLVPPRLGGDVELVDLPRDSDCSTPNQVTFTSSSRPTMFNVGVMAGDIIAVHEETFFHGSDQTHQTVLQTAQGSTQVTAPTTSGNIFTSSMEGSLLFVEEGNDVGGYRITTVVDGKTLILDKPLTTTTPTILSQGQLASYEHTGPDDILTTTAGAFNWAPFVGMYVTIYGVDTAHQGSYAILAHVGPNKAKVSKTPDFPAGPVAFADAHYLITAAPISPPTPTANGTELVAAVPIRIYDDNPTEKTITSVLASPTTSRVVFTGTFVNGFDQPFRIYRPDVRRITPTEISEKPFGALFYFDTEVVSLEPQDAANLEKESYLTIEPSTYVPFGYRFEVDDFNLTYSMNESGVVALPTSILPVGSADSPENFLTLVSTPLEVSYERADIVQRVQEFLSSPQDRVTVANLLARHFLPTYVSYDANYVGGSAASLIASDIFTFIDTLPVEEPIDVSKVEEKITRRGGNPDTPTQVVTVLHDWDRKVWAEFSENEIGGSATKVPYNGTPRVSYFIPGPDVSGQTTIPAGERINLTRR